MLLYLEISLPARVSAHLQFILKKLDSFSSSSVRFTIESRSDCGADYSCFVTVIEKTSEVSNSKLSSVSFSSSDSGSSLLSASSSRSNDFVNEFNDSEFLFRS